MTQDEIEIWLLDTISEGGYSFKELGEYIYHHGVEMGTLSKALLSVFDAGLIDIVILGDGEHFLLNAEDGRRSIADMSVVVAEEAKSRSMHYFQITTNGRELLDQRGISHE